MIAQGGLLHKSMASYFNMIFWQGVSEGMWRFLSPTFCSRAVWEGTTMFEEHSCYTEDGKAQWEGVLKKRLRRVQ